MNDTTQPVMTDAQFNELERQFPDAALVTRYLEIRDFLKAEAEAQAAWLAPQTENMKSIANELHRRLLKRNPDWQPGMKANGSTDAGTFFLKTNNSIRVGDREAFFQFLIEDASHRIPEFVTAHVAKEAVEGYMDKHRALPPGITIERITELQVRKT